MSSRLTAIALSLIAITSLIDLSEAKAIKSAMILAPPASTERISPLTQTMTDWSECRAKNILSLLQLRLTDKEVLTKAYKNCQSQELAVNRAWIKELGPNFAQLLASRKDRWRADFLLAIKKTRAGSSLTQENASVKYGACISDKLRRSVNPSDSIDAEADRIIAACSTYAQSAAAALSKQTGTAYSKEALEQFRQAARKIVMDNLAQKYLTR